MVAILVWSVEEYVSLTPMRECCGENVHDCWQIDDASSSYGPAHQAKQDCPQFVDLLASAHNLAVDVAYENAEASHSTDS